jgi:hypothetical protein
MIPKGASSYNSASSCRDFERDSLPADPDAAVAVVPDNRIWHSMGFYVLFADSVTDYAIPWRTFNDTHIFFFAEYSSRLPGFNDLHCRSRQEAIIEHLKSLTIAHRPLVQAQYKPNSMEGRP